MLDSKRPEDRRSIGGRPSVLDYLSTAAPTPTSTGCSRASRRSASPTSSTRASSGGSTTTPAPLFEFAADALDVAQNAIGGGGRYDGLVEAARRPAGTPGVGFGAGIERILLACDAEGVWPARRRHRPTRTSSTPRAGEALAIADELRAPASAPTARSTSAA